MKMQLLTFLFFLLYELYNLFNRFSLRSHLITGKRLIRDFGGFNRKLSTTITYTSYRIIKFIEVVFLVVFILPLITPSYPISLIVFIILVVNEIRNHLTFLWTQIIIIYCYIEMLIFFYPQFLNLL